VAGTSFPHTTDYVKTAQYEKKASANQRHASAGCGSHFTADTAFPRCLLAKKDLLTFAEYSKIVSLCRIFRLFYIGREKYS